MAHLDTLMLPNAGSNRVLEEELQDDHNHYNASLWHQFSLLMRRFAVTYWRSPSYSIGRHFVNIVIALIFASAYPNQSYDDYVETVSRAAVIFVTSLFCGLMAMSQIIPILMAERPVFYHEQQSRMYCCIYIYCLAEFLIE
eukprot:gene21963-26612_t